MKEYVVYNPEQDEIGILFKDDVRGWWIEVGIHFTYFFNLKHVAKSGFSKVCLFEETGFTYA